MESNDRHQMEMSFTKKRYHYTAPESEQSIQAVAVQQAAEQKKELKQVYVIRRSIFLIFVFFSAIIMLTNLGMLTIGLSYNRLQMIIETGARPPTLVNIAIMAEAGSTISLDSIAQSQNDLLIARSFFERILADRAEANTSRRRSLEDWEFNDQPQGQPQDSASSESNLPASNDPPDASQPSEETGQHGTQDTISPSSDSSESGTAEGQESGEEGDTTNDPAPVVDPEPVVDPCEIKKGFHSVPSFCIKEGFETSYEMNLYYTHGSHTSTDDWSVEQAEDFQVCSNLLFLVQDVLGYTYTNFPKLRGYVGFKSGGFCLYPTEYVSSFSEKSDSFREKCSDQSGYYNPLCRPWFQAVLQNPNQSVMSDLYPDASTKELITSLCISVNDPSTGEFYATICMDITIVQYFFDTMQTQSKLGPTLYYRPAILQLENEFALQHLSENILRSQTSGFNVYDKYHASLYGDFEINLGEFKVSGAVQDQDYNELNANQQFGLIIDPEQDTKLLKVFFIFSNLVFESLPEFAAASYQFFIFGRYEGIASINEMQGHLFITVFRFWMPYLIAASALYMIICGVIINYIATSMTKPFLELSARIRLNVENIKRQKRKSEQEERRGRKPKQFNSIELQVDLLRNYKPRNKETNELFLKFNQMAKILYIGQASSQMEFSYQAFFDLTAAGELLRELQNKRGCGACYMIVGIMLAVQSHETYHRCMNYIKYSEQLQEEIIEQHKRAINKNDALLFASEEAQHPRRATTKTEIDDMNHKIIEDKYIMAFRQYTHAIISHNYFVRMDEESRHKYLKHEERRIDYMRSFEDMGLDALHYFEKCLQSWPDPDLTQMQQRYDTYRLTQNISEHGITLQSHNAPDGAEVPVELAFGTTNAPNQDDEKAALCPQAHESPSANAYYGNTDTKSKRDTVQKVHHPESLAELEKHELSMLSKATPLKILHKESFEAQLDHMLLSDPHRGVGVGKKQSRENFTKVPALQLQDHSTAIQNQKERGSSHNPNVLVRVQRLSVSSRDQLQPLSHGDDQLSEDDDDDEDDSDSDFSQSYRSSNEMSLNYSDLDESGEQRLLQNLQSFRVFGGRKHGQLQDGYISDGFADYRIYIKLLMCELKILLLPLYLRIQQKLNEGDDEEDGSIRGTVGQQSDDEDSARKSNLSNERMDSEENIWDGYSPENKQVKPKQLNLDKLAIYQKFFFRRDQNLLSERKDGALEDVGEMDREIRQLYNRVSRYSMRRLYRIKRMGLPKLKKSFLVQNYHYLVGLRQYNVGNRTESELTSATLQLQNSLNCSNQQINVVSKKALLKLNNILQLLYDQKWNQMYNENLKMEFIRKRQAPTILLPPRRLTKEFLDRTQLNTRKKSVKIDPNSLHVMSPTIERIDETMSQASHGTSQYASKREQLSSPVYQNEGLKMIVTNLRWVRQHLSHHVVNRRSICFVLDTYFEHQKQHSLCREFIIETFEELHEEDYFGLLMRQDLACGVNEDILEINLEQKGKNVQVKERLLDKLNMQENSEPRRQTHSYMVQQLAQALKQSSQLPEKMVQYQDLEFVSPTKWVVAFIGSLKGLMNTSLLEIEDNTNLIVVYLTDETPEQDTITQLCKMIKTQCMQGGLLIVRYRESENQNSKQYRSSDQIIKALQRIKSMITLYPSKNMPIIQEKFAL